MAMLLYRQIYKLTIKGQAALPEHHAKQSKFDTGDRQITCKIIEKSSQPNYEEIEKWAGSILREGEVISALALIEIEELGKFEVALEEEKLKLQKADRVEKKP